MDQVATRVIARCLESLLSSKPEFRSQAASRADGAVIALIEGGHLALTEVEGVRQQLDATYRSLTAPQEDVDLTSTARGAIATAVGMAASANEINVDIELLVRALILQPGSAAASFAQGKDWTLPELRTGSVVERGYRGPLLDGAFASVLSSAKIMAGHAKRITTIHLLASCLKLGRGPLVSQLRERGVDPEDLLMSVNDVIED